MVSKAQVMALASGDAWLAKGANILLFGPRRAASTHPRDAGEKAISRQPSASP